ncbi:hypothetical protein [Luteolibacter luteus]|uniref:Uncharacterized protein n=1 Tax=Luteolibacter luteus TaxID=2728835 RepID=A0A858RLR3_9BACT|nr:hypothetical protein [Luteolibacter luteus]QJE98306.1 hypothetical protein HHL09_21825 [Luteolibacter luteus]
MATASAVGLVSCSGKKKQVVPMNQSTMVASETAVDFRDEHFRFSIRGLDSKWQVVDKERRLAVAPESAVAVSRVGGTYGAVVVEPVGGMELEAYAELIRSNYAGLLQDLEAAEPRKAEIGGIPALQQTITGKLNGIELDYEIVSFFRGDLGYQIMAWEPRKEADRGNLTSFIAAVSLDEGEITFPPPDTLPDGIGVGNRVLNNRYESAISRLAAEPSGPWGLMWGASLASTGEDAEIGLARPDLGLYITVASEAVDESRREKFVSSATSTLVEEAEIKGKEHLDFAGTPFECTRALVAGEMPIEIYLGNFVRGDLGYQFKAWRLQHKRKDEPLFDFLKEGLKSFSFLDDAAAEKLRTALVASPDSFGAVGEGFSVRGGVYRNFGAGIAWKRPAGFWKFHVGDQARARNEDISFQAMEIEKGLNTQLLVEDWSEGDATQYHEAAAAALEEGNFQPGTKVLPPLVVDGQQILRSCYVLQAEDAVLEYHLCTTLKDGQGIQMNTFAKVEVMEAFPKLAEECLTAYTFPGDSLNSSKTSGGRFHDLRMGFQMSLADGPWTIAEQPHPVISKLGNIVSFTGQSGVVTHFAIQTDGSGNDASFATKMMENIFRVNLNRSSTEGSTSRPETIAGLPATVRSGASAGTHMNVILFQVGGVAHFGVIVAKNEKTADKILKDYIAGFSLVP